jgi:hypothetical protein
MEGGGLAAVGWALQQHNQPTGHHVITCGPVMCSLEHQSNIPTGPGPLHAPGVAVDHAIVSLESCDRRATPAVC